MSEFLAHIAPPLAELLRSVADYLDGDPVDESDPLPFDIPFQPESRYRINERGAFEAIDI